MALTYTLRPINQQKCFDKAKNKTEFLIAAKCRFGKTFVASEIAVNGWFSEKILVVSGMKSVEKEWADLFKEQYPGFKNFTFTTVQAAGNDSEKAKKLKEEYKGCTLIFDEAHFGEQTDRTQEIIRDINPSRKLYLTATPYTCSLVKQFSKENQFNYSIQDEFEDYFKDPENFVKKNNYTPISVSLSILQSNELYENTKGIEVWTKAAWKEFKKELDSKNYKTFIYFVQSKKQADEVKKSFEKFDELKGHIHQLSGTENERGSEEFDEESTRRYYEDVKAATERCYEAKQKDEYFCIIACRRGGTGVTFKGLDCVVFYNAPNSAIDFIQKSYRCANPDENKTKATVYCFNKESALSVYLRTNQLEAARKGRDPKDNFEDFKRFFQLEGDFKDYDFGALIQELGKSFSWRLFDVSGIDLSLFTDDGFQIRAEKDKYNNNAKDLAKESKRHSKAQKENDKKAEEAIEKESKKEAEALEKKRRAIFEAFVRMFTEVEYVQEVFNFDIQKTVSYPEIVWSKIEIRFTRDQWENLIANNGKAVEKYLENQNTEFAKRRENTKEKERKFREKTKEELKAKYKEAFTKTVKEVETRDSGLQAELKELSFEKNGIIFGRTLEGCDYAHITPFSDVKCTDVSFDFENGLILPHRIHHCWDIGDLDFEVLENNYLKIVVLRETDDTEGQNGRISDRPISEGQKYYLSQRGAK